MKTAVIYLRVSTGKQAEKELPLNSQLDKCVEKAKELKCEVLKVFSDKGLSGRTDRRPEFQSAIHYCENNEVDYFITWSTSRFARNMVEAKLNKDRLAKAGTMVEYCTVKIDHKNESGFLHESILEIFDEYHSIQVSVDTTRSMRKNAQEGYWNGGTVPFGYKVVKAEENPKRKRLVPEPVEAAIVNRIFKARLEGLGFKTIAKNLNDAKITKRGKPWSSNSVHYLLSNEILLGKTVYGRRDGRGNEMPEESWIIINSHQPIVSQKTFDQAQQITCSPDKKGGIPKSNWLLSGILIHQCGYPMNIEGATGRNKVYYYYSCSGGTKGINDCKCRLPASALEEFITDKFLNGILSKKVLKRLMEDMAQLKGTRAKRIAEETQSLELQLSPLKKKRARLFEVLENPDLGLNMGDLAPRLRELNDEIAKIQHRLAVLDKESEEVPVIDEKDVDDFYLLIRKTLTSEKVPVRLKRKFLEKFVDQIEIMDEFAKVTWSPEGLLTVNPEMIHSENSMWLPLLDSNQRHMD